MLKFLFSITLCFVFLYSLEAQTIQDDFEGNGNIGNWFGDACLIDSNFVNPFQQGINTSTTVLKYDDNGGQYANVRFDIGRNLNLSVNATFQLKVYVPTSGVTGMQPNQISIKLQDGTLTAPWTTQSEIIKPIVLDQWQTIQVDFASDPYINLDPNSLPPTQRNDFNRLLVQVNGENNNDHVIAYIDDFHYLDTAQTFPPTVFNQLVWSDEFNGNGMIDTSKWFHQTQLPNGVSWFNGEIQHYTNRNVNAYQSNGVLNLVAKKEVFTDQGQTKQYTSARLNSKFAFTHGRVEIMAKLPTGVGTWPAIWMLGKNITETGAYWQTKGFGTTAWPACGEIDIMEHWGNNQNHVTSATHTPSSSGNTINVGGQTIPTVSSAFHLYALEWTKNSLVFSVDSVVHFIYNPANKNLNNWPFDADQYLLLNIAIQSSIAANFTQSAMEIDYIRVYQQSTVGIKENKISRSPNFYPNPVTDHLTIQLEDATSSSTTLQIYQLNGTLISESVQIIENNRIHLENLNRLPKGIYFVSFIDGQQTNHLKFIKQ